MLQHEKYTAPSPALLSLTLRDVRSKQMDKGRATHRWGGKNKRALHRNLIALETQIEGEDVDQTAHSHLPETGDFITATDICTLMLYGKFTDWDSHVVVSEKYYNIWNCKTNSLLVMDRETMAKSFEKMEKTNN